MHSSLAGCFGKIRSHADFVRHNADAFHEAGLEPWLDHGFQETLRAVKASWDHVQRALTQVRFVYSDPTRDVSLLGTLGPSSDKVGRRFPLVIFAPFDPRLGAAEACVLAGEFLTRAEELAELAGRGIDITGFKAQVSSLRAPSDAAECDRVLRQHCQDTPILQLAEVLGSGQGITGLAQWLTNAAAAFEEGAPKYVVRSSLPFGEKWVAVALCLLRAVSKHATPRLALWDSDRASVPGTRGRLRMCFSDQIAGSFAPLVFPEIQVDRAWDLGSRPAVPVHVPPCLRGSAEEVLGRQGARTNELVQSLGG